MVEKVTAVMAEGKRPATFRTRKLSPPAPMVLHPTECGRVGHRRTNFDVRAAPFRDGPHAFIEAPHSPSLWKGSAGPQNHMRTQPQQLPHAWAETATPGRKRCRCRKLLTVPLPSATGGHECQPQPQSTGKP